MNPLVRRVCNLTSFPGCSARRVHGNAELVRNCEEIQNRNPRNLELIRIARKPTGYHLEKTGREFWHKLILTKSSRHVTAEIVHFENKTVLTASTSEWAIKKQLYKAYDTSAYVNLGRVLAQRCLESGIVAVRCDYTDEQCGKIKLFLAEMEKGGVSLQEPDRYIHAAPWDWFRHQKPWEVED